MSPQIERFVQSKSIAVVGFSRTGKKFGNVVGKELIKRGYEVFPVHPEVSVIEDLKCYPSLTSLDGKAEALLICIPPSGVPKVLEEAVQASLTKVWLQQGSWSKEVQQTIDRLELEAVSKKCILMYAPPVTSIHKFHRTIVSLFGGL